MAICLLGINHKTADVKIREQFTVAETDYASHLERLIEHPEIEAAAVLSTCNRTEYYISTPSVEQLEQALDRILAFDHRADHVYLKSDQDCAAHLFSVAAGIDSLVLGETQIQGQVKRAFDEAKKVNTNSELNKLFQLAFKTAKMVRSETEIGRNPVSVAHCAVQLGRQIFGSLDEQKVLIIGAGETAELLIRYLINHQATHITISNRSPERAAKLASHFSAKTMPLDRLAQNMSDFDLVFTATASPVILLDKKTISNALQVRKFKPMVLIDLSVPRDIDEQIKDLDDAFLYTVDDLEAVITKNMQRRHSTLEEASRIIDAEAALLNQWLSSRKHHDLLKQYHEKITALKEQVLSNHGTAQWSAEQQAKIQTLAHQLTRKLTHVNMVAMKRVIESGNEEHIRLLAELFELEHMDES